MTALLNDPLCLEFIQSIAFRDAKRPITKNLLQRIDLKALYGKVNRQAYVLRVRNELEHQGIKVDLQATEAFSMEDFFEEYAPHVEQARYTMDALFPDDPDLLRSTILQVER